MSRNIGSRLRRRVTDVPVEDAPELPICSYLPEHLPDTPLVVRREFDLVGQRRGDTALMAMDERRTHLIKSQTDH